jgi:hypothetical protein
VCSDVSHDNILNDQYILSRYCNIGFMDSNLMPEFERKFMVAKLLKDKKKELDKLNRKPT